MKRTLQTWVGFMTLAVALGGCGAPPPAPPPTPKPQPPPEPEPEEPKCEAIRDACKATSSTRVPVPDTDYVFTPPEGWIYAKLEEAAVAQVGDEGPVLVLTSFVPKDKNTSRERTELAKSFAELVLIEPPRGLALFRAQQKQELAGLKMQFWEKPNAKRGGDTGALLVISADLEDRQLFGVGFAPKQDEDGTGEILRAIQSLDRETDDK